MSSPKKCPRTPPSARPSRDVKLANGQLTRCAATRRPGARHLRNAYSIRLKARQDRQIPRQTGKPSLSTGKYPPIASGHELVTRSNRRDTTADPSPPVATAGRESTTMNEVHL